MVVCLRPTPGTIFPFNNLEQVTLSPDVMAFAVEILPRGFALLFSQFLLLLLYPAEFGNGKDADGIEIHAKRVLKCAPGPLVGRR